MWVCRHGERADALPGWAETASRPQDPPLTPLGCAQAAATARALAGERIDAVYSSPFLRCMQTAAAIAAAHGLQVRIEPGLGEFLNSSWYDTHPIDAEMSDDAISTVVGSGIIDREYVPIYEVPARRAASPQSAAAPDTQLALNFPEDIGMSLRRYEHTLRALQSSAPFSLLVTHGFGVQAMAESCEGVEVIECDYCALTLLRRDGDPAEGEAQWRCDVLCSATHTEGVTADGESAVDGTSPEADPAASINE